MGEPTLAELAARLAGFAVDRPGSGPDAWLEAVGGTADLSVPTQRDELRRWLNKWGCRLGYPPPGAPDLFSASVAAWWAAGGAALPDAPLAELSDADIAALADGYADLSARPALALTRGGVPAGVRSIGPTTTSKLLYFLRPQTVPPWDAAVARGSVGGSTREHFAAHLVAGRAWAQVVLASAAQAGIADVAAHVGQPGASLARLRDAWLLLTVPR
jgi:hypothetical protein